MSSNKESDNLEHNPEDQIEAETEGTGGEFPSSISPEVRSALTIAQGQLTVAKKELEGKIASLGTITKIAILALTIAIIIISYDIIRDNANYDNLQKDIRLQNLQIIDSNQKLLQHREEELLGEKETISECLKSKKSPWNYPKCFE